MLRIYFATLVVALASLFSPVSHAQEHFTSCYNGEGNIFNATIIVPVSSKPAVNGSLLSSGSEIGVFSATPGSDDKCVGIMVWQNRNGAITIWGDDELTSYRDGLFAEEAFSFRVWDASLELEYPAETIIPSFSVGSPRYGHDLIYVLSEFNVSSLVSGITVTNDTAVTEEDTAVTVDVLANDFDPVGDGLVITDIFGPANGVASITPEGYIQYKPNNNYFGPDSLSYVAIDGRGNVAQGHLVIDVASVNDVPVFTSAPLTSAILSLAYNYAAEATDVDGDSLTISAPALPPWLSITDSGNATLTLEGTPAPGDLGVHEVLLELTDGKVVVEQRFSIDVNDVTTPLPVASEPSLPAYGAMNIPLEPQLSWQPIASATSYHVQLTRNEDALFESPVINDSTVIGTIGPSNDVVYRVAALEEGMRYRWRVRGRNGGGTSPWSDVQKFTTEGFSTTPTEDAPELPKVVELHQNYPNPFNPATTIVYELPRAIHVRIEIFNVLGVRIQTLVDATRAAGRHELQWTAEHLPSGIYLYRLMAGSTVLTRTLSLTK